MDTPLERGEAANCRSSDMDTKYIQNLNEQKSVSGTDQIPIASFSATGDTRRVPVSALSTYIQAQLQAPPDGKVTQYASPAAAGTVTINQVNGVSVPVFLYLTPVAPPIATMTLTLPGQGVAVDRQEVLVATASTITALTVNAAAGGTGTPTVVNAPTTLVAGAGTGSFRMRYDAPNNVWVMVT